MLLTRSIRTTTATATAITHLLLIIRQWLLRHLHWQWQWH
jgi:hypothetical protein